MTSTNDKVRILFVCLGNICRSPVAEGVFRSVADEAGLLDRFHLDSAGTGSWHVGQAPDRRMRETAARHGVDISRLEGRQFVREDLASFDLILAMDADNLARIDSLSGPTEHTGIKLFRDFDPDPGDRQVPDPYYGGADGFEVVYEMVERTCRSLLSSLTVENDW